MRNLEALSSLADGIFQFPKVCGAPPPVLLLPLTGLMAAGANKGNTGSTGMQLPTIHSGILMATPRVFREAAVPEGVKPAGIHGGHGRYLPRWARMAAQ